LPLAAAQINSLSRTSAQVEILDSVYAGDALNRCPYLVLTATALTPKPAAATALLLPAAAVAAAGSPPVLPGAAQELAQVRRYWKYAENLPIMFFKYD
jgi:hypothetical protein